MKKHVQALQRLNVCSEAVDFACQHPTLSAAWLACDRGDWMLWLLGRLAGDPDSASRKKLVLAACACARKALRYVSKGEKRPLVAIQTAERWARGEEGVTVEQVRTAANATNAATNAANAAAYATYAANARERARRRMLATCAKEVRKLYPRAPRLS